MFGIEHNQSILLLWRLVNRFLPLLANQFQSTKLFLYIVINQTALHECDQVPIVIRNDESVWTMTPPMCYRELVEDRSMFFVSRVEGY